VFVDDSQNRAYSLNGYRVISFEELTSPEHNSRKVVVAIGSGEVRSRLEEKCKGAGLCIITAIAPTSVIMDEVTIGDGSVICDHVILTSNIKIGRSFQANLNCYVGHDCIIGDHVTFAPRVNCNGNVHIGDNVYVGTNASIIQGSSDEPLTIGANSVVGMGAVVTKPVPARSVVAGNPARVIRTLDQPS
jgi:sugar O-acyltransferase (sialic acid O-acetyltransferase NeuD family)